MDFKGISCREEGSLIALYMRLSGADGDLDGEKAESNSISNQRKILRGFVVGDANLACQDVEEFVDDGFSGSNFDRPGVQRMLDLCKSGQVNVVIVKDLSRFAREYIDAGTYIEQVFPFLRVRFISIAEGFDSAYADLDRSAPDIAIRNIANAAYCRDTSIRIKTTLHTKWRRGLRPHAMPPFGYMVDPDDPMKLAIDERFSPTVWRVFELAIALKDPKSVARVLNGEGIDIPGVAFRKHGLYGFDKRPEPKTKKWASTNVLRMISDPVYKGTLVAGKTCRKVMGKRPVAITDDSERYVTEDAHPAIVDEETWFQAQACMRTKEHLKGVRHAAPRSPFANGFVVRAECGHSCKPNRREKSSDFYSCECDCAADDKRRISDEDIADAIVEALGSDERISDTKVESRQVRRTSKKRSTTIMQLEAYERYVSGAASIDDYRSLETEAFPVLHESAASRLLGSNLAKEKKTLVAALAEHRFSDVDRKLLRRLVRKVLVHEGGRPEVILD